MTFTQWDSIRRLPNFANWKPFSKTSTSSEFMNSRPRIADIIPCVGYWDASSRGMALSSTRFITHEWITVPLPTIIFIWNTWISWESRWKVVRRSLMLRDKLCHFCYDLLFISVAIHHFVWNEMKEHVSSDHTTLSPSSLLSLLSSVLEVIISALFLVPCKVCFLDGL